MTDAKRRRFFAGALLASATGPLTAGAAESGESCPLPLPIVTVTPEDTRYSSLVVGHNQRFVGTPRRVVLVSTTEQVVAVVQRAVNARQRFTARSGGHCFEGFTAAPDIEVVIDLSPMSTVEHDRSRRAFAIGPGATLGQVYRALFRTWNVTIPGGSCLDVAVGGHIMGGGYGHLSRRNGLVADHLYAVEVVVVDASGQVRTVVATRDEGDPNRDLWWAHAGGGGGSFGVVTKYWLRSRGVTSDDPSALLPHAVGTSRRRTIFWPWKDITEAAFTRLVRNYCDWYEQHSAPGVPETNIWGILQANHISAGQLGVIAVSVNDAVPGSAALLKAHIDALTDGVGVTPVIDDEQVFPWMTPQNWPFEPSGLYKHKAADHRKGYTDTQIAAIWRNLSDTSYQNPAANLGLSGYGGQVNALAPGETAVSSRDAILRAVYSTGNWTGDGAPHLAWVRRFYADVYAATGGVPVPNDLNSGSYINYPDIDLLDSNPVPWTTLYYRDNYPRLQRVKQRYDPRDVFRHALSVRLPS